MKMESLLYKSLVSYTAVNPFPGLVHTGRHTMEASYTESRYFNHNRGKVPKVRLVTIG